MFATVMPGLAPVAAAALSQLSGVSVRDSGFDGRNDVVLFDAARDGRRGVFELGLTEDVFVEVGRTPRALGDRAPPVAGRLWRPEPVQRALSVYAEEVRPLSGTMTFRVIVRVLQERSYRRTELRRHVTDVISRDRPRWRWADPAQLEVWVSEYTPGRFVAGFRLSDASMRQRDGRAEEREGALRATVARAMVHLAGVPDGALLDPCCGSGTILSEAAAHGWETIRGLDIDPEAVRITRENVDGVSVDVGDIRRIDLADASVAACVSNLPFGRQHAVEGDVVTWRRQAVAELVRVTRLGGRVVLLVPDLPRPVPGLVLRERHPIRLLGLRATIWVLER
jgi:SAM-dependent methyltransferase